MKVCASASLLFMAIAAARGDGSLRGSSTPAQAEEKGQENERLASDSGYSGLTLMLDHVKAGQTESDDVVIGAIVDSYNKFHSGYAIVSAFKDEEIVIPEPDSDGVYDDILARYTVGWTCTACAEDEGMLPPLQVVALTNSLAHQQFVDELCKSLRESGKPAYEGVYKCAVDFTYGTAKTAQLAAATAQAGGNGSEVALGWPWGRKKDDKPSDKSGLPMGAEINIRHVLDGDNTDFDAVSKVFIEAYNDVHSDMGVSITSFGIDRQYTYLDPDSEGWVNVTEGDEFEDGEERRSLENCRYRIGRRCCESCRMFKGWLGSGDFGCRLCRDERNVLPPLTVLARGQFKENRMKVTEKLFCHKLAKLDSPPYRDVRDCKISLITPDEDSHSWLASGSSSAAATDLA